jgi:hypothetical protein
VRQIFASLENDFTPRIYFHIKRTASGVTGPFVLLVAQGNADETDSEVKLQCQLKDSWITSADDASKRS